MACRAEVAVRGGGGGVDVSLGAAMFAPLFLSGFCEHFSLLHVLKCACCCIGWVGVRGVGVGVRSNSYMLLSGAETGGSVSTGTSAESQITYQEIESKKE